MKLINSLLDIPAEIILSDNSAILKGTLNLDSEFITNIDNIFQVEIRIVGGVVSKYDEEFIDHQIHVRGTERLFDKKVLLYDSNNASEANHKCPPAIDFGIKIPHTSPPSCLNEKCHVQYVVVAAVYYHGGCWSWIPAFTPDPTIIRKEIQVRKLLDHSGQYNALKVRIVDKNQTLLYHPQNALNNVLEDNVLGHVSIATKWKNGFQLTCPAMIARTDKTIPIRVSSKNFQKIKVICHQIEVYNYKYNVDPTTTSSEKYKNIACKSRKEKVELFKSQEISEMQVHDDVVYIIIADGTGKEFLPDIDTIPVKIRHILEIQVQVTETERLDTNVAVVMYEMPENISEEEDVMTLCEGEFGEGVVARAAEAETEGLRKRMIIK